MALFRLLPRSLSIGMLNLAALLAYWVDVKHRRIARTNLTIAFPELTPRERDRIGWRSFQNTARNLVEAARLPLLSPQNIGSLVEYDSQFGLENYLLARRTGKPLLYLTGHFSAWELLPAAHALYGYPLSFVTRPLDNPPLERYVLRLREASGNKTVPKKNSTRVILEKLKQGEAVGRKGFLRTFLAFLRRRPPAWRCLPFEPMQSCFPGSLRLRSAVNTESGFWSLST